MQYGRVTAVRPDSPGELAGVTPGDRLVSINGNYIRDIIDYRFYSAEEIVDIVFLHGDEPVEVIIEKDIDEPLGLDFEEELFDGIRTCDNCCVFCFVHQLPQGMRESLYVRDDDYRLSFLHGNFVTLTAVSEDDIKRIITQRLSPMYVSVHTTNEALRRELLCSSDAPEIMPQLRALSEGGITLHTQIVLCPGRNDGEEMERTIDDLASLHPALQSIAIVPVGLTRHRKRKEPLPAVDSALASKTLTQVRHRQRGFLKALGSRLVYASDEMYLAAGARIPKAAGYEGFPQLENGVGLVRRFLDNAARVIPRFPERINGRLRGTVVTGASAAPILQQFLDKLNETGGLEMTVEVIENDFFGHTVTVAGLLTGKDVVKQLKGRELGDVVFLPSVCLRDKLFLDDMPVESIEKELDVPVRVVAPKPSALTAAILELVDSGTEEAA